MCVLYECLMFIYMLKFKNLFIFWVLFVEVRKKENIVLIWIE